MCVRACVCACVCVQDVDGSEWLKILILKLLGWNDIVLTLKGRIKSQTFKSHASSHNV